MKITKITILVLLVFSIILLSVVGCVSAEKITVGEKHILGNGGGATYGGPLFIITTDNHEDYIVTVDTYYKVHINDTVELNMINKYGYWELTSNDDSWW